MKIPFLALIALLTASFAVFGRPTFAQEKKPSVFYIEVAPDGIKQIYQQRIDNASEARQITHAKTDVLTFQVAHDGLSVAYISDRHLWLQPLHTEEAEALASIGPSDEDKLYAPVYSPDGQYIAYAADGVWLLDLATRETHLIIKNTRPREDGSTSDKFRLEDGSTLYDFRFYRPSGFVLDDNGNISKLIVSVRIAYEYWDLPGVYDLASGKVQVFDTLHTSLLPLSDGRVLVYGDNNFNDQFGLHIADSLDDINTETKVLDYRTLTDAHVIITQAFEISPGIIRLSGVSSYEGKPDLNAFYFDYHVDTGKADDLHLVPLIKDSHQVASIGVLSADGRLLPVYRSTIDVNTGQITDTLTLMDMITGETLDVLLPARADHLRWQG